MKQAKLAMEVLALMILVVVTSGIIFMLISMGVVEVKSGLDEVNILNTEFLPFERGGNLVVKEFRFCGLVDENLQCFNEQQDFQPGDDVYVHFLVESSNLDGYVMLMRNYRLTDPDGIIILDIETKNDYNFEMKSGTSKELIAFADYFTTDLNYKLGEYKLDLVLGNPLLDKKVTLSKTFFLTYEEHREGI